MYLLLFGVTAAVVLGEVSIRIAYGDKFGKRPVFYGPRDRVGWAPAPGLNHTYYGEDFSTHIRTDRNGYRLGALGEVDFSGRLIVLCGDSYTFGWGVSTEDTFASFLDEMVYRYTKGRMRVVNLSVGGHGTWQYYDRLRDFTQLYPGADIAAVVVYHCQNDVADNVKSVGFTLGLWKSAPKTDDKSRWHLVNFLRYSRKRILAPSGSPLPAGGPEHEDVLWGFNFGHRKPLPDVIEIDGVQVAIGRRSPDDTSAKRTWKREAFTDLQQQLYELAIRSIHRVAAGAGTRVLHAYVYTTDDWYISRLDKIIAGTPGALGVSLGRVPAPGAYEGNYINEHKGRHYTPDFNRFWAEQMFEQLQERGVIDVALVRFPER